MVNPVVTSRPIARAVTKDEHDFYQANGWVHLPRLIEPEVAAEIVRRAMQRMGFARTPERHNLGGVAAKDILRTYVNPAADDEYIAELAHSRELGSVAAHLLGRPVRRLDNEIVAKMPEGREFSRPTPWHQDLPYLPID